mmetsp:Transcript_126666/g.354593  ORF Transcript_126666/g.354593 Transcript_126666/m.354593 type:complete len:310 (-) Transcript_126666:282-1211(-)
MAHAAEKTSAPWYGKISAAVAGRGSTGEAWMVSAADPERAGDVPAEPRQWRSFALAEAMEDGAAPGLATDYVGAPAPEQEGEERLVVDRSPARTSYKLLRGMRETVLLAKASADGERFDIYVGAAADSQGDGPTGAFAAMGPTFTLTASSSARTSWSLCCNRCERCEARGARQCGRRELMRLTQYSEVVGDGSAFCMDVSLPPQRPDGSTEVSCQRCGGAPEALDVALTVRRPKWNARQKSLTLDFHGRCSMSSAKNFQLEDPRAPKAGPGKYKLLFGKIAEQRYVLDYRHPLGMVQAFAAALSTSHWK